MSQRFSIYLHTNKVNGKGYVGQTSGAMNDRWMGHVSAAKIGKGGAPVLSAAIRKYGASAFTHELLDVVTTQEGADVAESRWIEQRQTRVPNGYNLSSGGGGHGHHHENSKRLIGDAARARWEAMTPEERTVSLQRLHDPSTWTPQRLANHLKMVQATRHKVSAALKDLWSKNPGMSKNLVARQAAWYATLTSEQKREKALKSPITRRKLYGPTLSKNPQTLESRIKNTRSGWANATPEARAKRVLKIKESHLAIMAKMTPEALTEYRLKHGELCKEGRRKARVLRENVRKPNLLRFNLLPSPVLCLAVYQPTVDTRTKNVGGRAANPNLTLEVVNRAYEMRSAGTSLSKISAELCVPIATLFRVLKSNNTVRLTSPTTPRVP